MAGKGPPKTPTEILAGRGSWVAKARIVDGAIVAVNAKPDPVNPDAGVDEHLEEVHKLLMDMNVLSKADKHAAYRYAAKLVRWYKINAEIQALENEVSVESLDIGNGQTLATGKEYINPLIQIEEKLSNQLLQLERQFGLTPSARAYLRVEPSKEKEKPDGKQRFFVG